MKCSVEKCSNDACYLIPVYNQDKTIAFFEARCSKHKVVTLKESRDFRKSISEGRR